MGPTALFDKSFVQSLTVDESVWFDHFFMSVVCPTFFVETLADLAKTPREGRTAEAEVRIIASKFPQLHGCPCVDYMELCTANLLGHDFPLDGRIPRPGGRAVSGGARTGTVYDQSPEDAAFHRWGAEEFGEVERLFAAKWRAALQAVDLSEIDSVVRSAGISPKSCRSLADAHLRATQIVSDGRSPLQQIVLAVQTLRIPQQFHQHIFERWKHLGRPSLSALAPYTAFVVTVEIFFQIALAANLISSERNSNRTDIAYLFYLPFCQIFVSSDRLHRSIVSLFVRPDQEFVWGQDLKADLRKINTHFLQLPEADRERGINRLADYPPTGDASLVAEIWERCGSGPPSHHENLAIKMNPEAEKRLVAEITAFTKGATVAPFPISGSDHETVSVERRVAKRKGSWWQLPKDLRVAAEDE